MFVKDSEKNLKHITHKCKRIETGSYVYRGYILENLGYHEPTHSVV